MVLGSDHLCECDLDVRKPLEDPCAQKDGNWNKAGNQAKRRRTVYQRTKSMVLIVIITITVSIFLKFTV